MAANLGSRDRVSDLNCRSSESSAFPPFSLGPTTRSLGRLTDLRLNCLAALCRFKYPKAICSLYSYLRDGEDPIQRVAQKFYRRSRQLSIEKAEAEFRDLQGRDPGMYGTWINLARGILEILPLGLPSTLTRFAFFKRTLGSRA